MVHTYCKPDLQVVYCYRVCGGSRLNHSGGSTVMGKVAVFHWILFVMAGYSIDFRAS